MNRILLVDDDRYLSESVSQTLREKGWDVLCALSRTEALECIEKEYFDLAIVDLFLEPGSEEGGMEVARKIKEKDWELPVVILTAFGTTQRAVEAMKIPADDFVEKPPDFASLIQKIRSFLESTMSQQIVRKGLEIYRKKFDRVREKENLGKMLAIDIQNEACYLAESEVDAIDKALENRATPGKIALRKVGYRISETIGGILSPEEEE